MAMDSLIKFSAEVMRTAEDNRQAKLEKVRAAEAERLKAAETDIQSGIKSRVRVECEKIKIDTEREVSLLKSELKKKITSRRSEMFDEIFDEVLKNVREYKRSLEYITDTSAAILKAAEEMGGDEIICYALPEDIDELSKAVPSLSYKEANADIIGGFSLLSREKHLYLDMTLKSKIEEQKKKFYRKSGLVLS